MLDFIVQTAGEKHNVSMPLVEANNFTVVDHNCEMEGKSRKSNITIGWPADSPCYSLAILFTAVRVKCCCVAC